MIAATVNGRGAARTWRRVALVKLRGEHDLSSKPHLREALGKAGARCDVLVDLSGCTFMDSSVVSVLFRARRQLATRGGRLELMIPRGAATIQRFADVTLLASILPIHETTTAALASIESNPQRTGIRTSG